MRRALLLASLLALVHSASAAEPLEFSVGGFSFTRPDGWKWQSVTSPMRKAHLCATSPEGENADILFFHFGPGQGGAPQANIDRWISQFEGGTSSSSREKAGNRDVIFVQAEGSYLSGMPGTPAVSLDGFALRGAILPDKGGDVYVKMTGPKAAVEAAASAFRDMVLAAASRAATP